MLQEIAACAQRDGLNQPEIAILANLGSRGKYPGNTHVELTNKLSECHVSTALRKVQVFLKTDSLALTTAQYSMLLPHELFSIIYTHHFPQFMEHILGGDTDRIGAFWDAQTSHPGHPVRLRPDMSKCCIPITVHGDGVAVSGVGRSWSKTVDVYSWSSMLGRGTTLQTNFLSWMMYWKLRVDNPDMDCFAKLSKLFVWSLYWLFLGVWPKRDVGGAPINDSKSGTPLAGGYYCVLWGIKADLEHMAKCFGFPYPASAAPCGLCGADRTDTPWTDGRLEAKWRRTLLTNESHAKAHPNRHPLWTLPGVGVEMFTPDIMHTMHLGTYQYAFGSILEYMVGHRLEGPVARKVDRIWGKVREHYQAAQRVLKYYPRCRPEISDKCSPAFAWNQSRGNPDHPGCGGGGGRSYISDPQTSRTRQPRPPAASAR